MAQTLTLTQLQAAQNLITKGDLNGFYQYMSSMGYNYAGLADHVITDYYTKDGIEIRSTWVHSDGSSGTVNLFGDGTTLIPGCGAYDVPASQSIILQNPDGSYTTDDWNCLHQIKFYPKSQASY
jgi:hypothetical protein